MVELMTHGYKARVLAIFCAVAFLTVAFGQPVQAVKIKTIGAIAGGIGGALVGLGLWPLAATFMVAGAIGGGVVMGLLIPIAIFVVPTVVGAMLGGGLGAFLDKKFGGSSQKIQIDKSREM